MRNTSGFCSKLVSRLPDSMRPRFSWQGCGVAVKAEVRGTFVDASAGVLLAGDGVIDGKVVKTKTGAVLRGDEDAAGVLIACIWLDGSWRFSGNGWQAAKKMQKIVIAP